MPKNQVPQFDESTIVDTHFLALEDFLKDVWGPSGRSRKDIIAFIAPNRKEIQEDARSAAHSEIQERFARLGIQAHDLTDDFRREIVDAGGDINDYYWDYVHYVEEGHKLAARATAPHIIRLLANRDRASHSFGELPRLSGSGTCAE
jgi:hypothetical protein